MQMILEKIKKSDWVARWRFCFGAYLFFYGLLMIPYVTEVYAEMVLPEELERLATWLPAWPFAVSATLLQWVLWPLYLLFCFFLMLGFGGKIVPLLLFVF
jgi:hypothetical protein